MDRAVKLTTGATFTPLRVVANSKGNVYHGLKASESGFRGFGEAYFSTVLQDVTKGWKLHRAMTLNLIVPMGHIEFYLRSENGALADSVMLGESNYGRLTVPPGLWVAFKGLDAGLNLVLNIASIAHDPDEAVNAPLDQFPVISASRIKKVQ